MWSNNLISITDKKIWNQVRSSLSQLFASNKLKATFRIVQKHSTHLVDYVTTKSKEGKVTIDARMVFTRLSKQISADTFLGIQSDTIDGQKSEFGRMADKAIILSTMSGCVFILSKFLLKLLKLTGIKGDCIKIRQFFLGIIKQCIIKRFEIEPTSPDVINTLVHLHKVEKSHLDNINKEIIEKIAAQVLLLYYTGCETISFGLSMLVYELIFNPNIQQKLYQEIINTLEKFDGTVSFETIADIEYLDNVLSETLRLHTPTALVDRKATKDYVIEAERLDETSLLVEEGTTVWILQQAIHMDPNHFPNCEKFDPDRFSHDNKENIKPCSYIPFGSGPRSCIGYKYGIMVIKLVIVELLINFELLPTEKSYVENSHKTYNIVKHGVWVQLNPRKG